jgi:hypothetical protein
MPTARAKRPDKIDYRENGEICLTVANIDHVWELPKLGQYKKLRAIVLDGAAAQRADVLAGRPMDDGLACMIQFLVESNDALGNSGALPPEDEWPTWMVSTEVQAAILTHWRKVPLDHG